MTAVNVGFEPVKKMVDETPLNELEAVASAQEGGVDGVLDAVFEVYRSSFDPERAYDTDETFLFEIALPDGVKHYFLSVHDQTCRVGRGGVEDPSATIKLGLADFLQMSLGKTNGGVLAMSGRLEVSGDVFAAISFGEWFNPPWDEE
jgi:SCP-2 sterol transfer family